MYRKSTNLCSETVKFNLFNLWPILSLSVIKVAVNLIWRRKKYHTFTIGIIVNPSRKLDYAFILKEQKWVNLTSPFQVA